MKINDGDPLPKVLLNGSPAMGVLPIDSKKKKGYNWLFIDYNFRK